jgi:hypothetical protein
LKILRGGFGVVRMGDAGGGGVVGGGDEDDKKAQDDEKEETEKRNGGVMRGEAKLKNVFVLSCVITLRVKQDLKAVSQLLRQTF